MLSMSAIDSNGCKLAFIKSNASDAIATDRQVNQNLMFAPSIVAPSIERLQGSLRVM